mgnify:FL=1
MKKPDNCVVVIFGASGDLTKRKLIPAIFELFKQNNLPDKFAVLGTASSTLSEQEFREAMKAAILIKDSIADINKINEFTEKLNYFPMDFKDPDAYNMLSSKIKSLSGTCGENCNYIFYLATIPSLFAEISVNLGKAGLNKMVIAG